MSNPPMQISPPSSATRTQVSSTLATSMYGTQWDGNPAALSNGMTAPTTRVPALSRRMVIPITRSSVTLHPKSAA
jgi:hypothetical protein